MALSYFKNPRITNNVDFLLGVNTVYHYGNYILLLKTKKSNTIVNEQAIQTIKASSLILAPLVGIRYYFSDRFSASSELSLGYDLIQKNYLFYEAFGILINIKF